MSFLPAVAKVKQSQNDTKTSLLDALNNTNLDQRKYATSIQQNEFNLDEQRRQFEESQKAAREAAARAAAAASSFNAGSLLGAGGGGGAVAPTGASGTQVSQGIQQRADKGFNFTDNAGRAVNAFQYSQGHGIPFTTLLKQMANAGDSGARTALNFMGDNGNADPTKITNQALANLYQALTGRGVGVFKPAAAPAPARLSIAGPSTPFISGLVRR